MFYSFCELFIIFIFNFSRRLSDESDLPDFGAADIFKDYDTTLDELKFWFDLHDYSSSIPSSISNCANACWQSKQKKSLSLS